MHGSSKNWHGLRVGWLGFSLRRVSLATSAVLVAGYLALTMLVGCQQARLVYFPSQELRQTPAARQLVYEQLHLQAEDPEVLLHGWWVPHPGKQARGTVLICHGNAGNIGDRLDTIEFFHQLGFDVCIFDYRGYGQSGGTPSEQGTYQDAETFWHYLVHTRGVAPDKLLIFGRSLGGGVAVELARRHPPGAVLLESTFTSIAAMARQLYPYLPTSLLTRIHYDNLGKIGQLSCLVIIAHSRQDEMIPFAHATELFAAAREPKALFELQGDHNNSFAANYVSQLRQLLAKPFPES